MKKSELDKNFKKESNYTCLFAIGMYISGVCFIAMIALKSNFGFISGVTFIIFIFLLVHNSNRIKKVETQISDFQLTEEQRKRMSNSKELKRYINKHYRILKCVRCNSTEFDIERFNSDYDTMEIICKTCNKKTWIKSFGKILQKEKNFILQKDLHQDFFLRIKSNTKHTNEKDQNRQSIPSQIRDKVWRRDQGKCVKCGSRKNLEFDHIIPVSKGGSNTARNIELLCEKCNRSKGAKIE